MNEKDKRADDSRPERDAPKADSENAGRGENEYVLTAKDAGWRSPGVFVMPVTFVPIDPPEPRRKRPPPE